MLKIWDKNGKSKSTIEPEMKNVILLVCSLYFFNCGSTSINNTHSREHYLFCCLRCKCDLCRLCLHFLFAWKILLWFVTREKKTVRKIVATFSKIAICDISLHTFALSQLYSTFKNKLGIENRATAICVIWVLLCCYTTDALWKMAKEKNEFK